MSGFQNAKESLAAVRSVLLENKVDAFIVGSGDAHQSEYVCDRDMRRQFVSKFNGSAGTALILQNAAYLWTDGRYFLQASSELSDDWTLMKSGEPKVLELADWVVENLSAGQSVGIDATLITTSQATAMKNLFGAKGISLVSLEQNPVDIVWAKANQPAAPSSAINVHGEDRSGVSHQSKILSLQAFVREAKASAIVISMLDEVVWLFNIRGSDVDFNPVVIGYAVVTLDKAYLFVDPTKVTSAVNEHFGDAVEVRPYEEVESFLAQLALSGPVVADPSQLNWRLYQALGSSVVDRVSPVALAKSVKNDVELNGIRQAHIRDGAALTAFIHWLETTVKRSPESLTEVDAMDMLEEFRGRVKDHKGPSFPTIAGYGPNGAIIHYHAEKHNTSQIGVNSLFLLDSGGQYLDGTTDVTRWIIFDTDCSLNIV
jgi:Xaa-Pro aminopeptidase